MRLAFSVSLHANSTPGKPRGNVRIAAVTVNGINSKTWQQHTSLTKGDDVTVLVKGVYLTMIWIYLFGGEGGGFCPTTITRLSSVIHVCGKFQVATPTPSRNASVSHHKGDSKSLGDRAVGCGDDSIVIPEPPSNRRAIGSDIALGPTPLVVGTAVAGMLRNSLTSHPAPSLLSPLPIHIAISFASDRDSTSSGTYHTETLAIGLPFSGARNLSLSNTRKAIACLRVSDSASKIVCKWLVKKNIPPSKRSSKRTPISTSASNLFRRWCQVGNLYSPTMPTSKTRPAIRRPHSETSSPLLVADLESDKRYPTSLGTWAGAVGFMLQICGVAYVLFKKMRDK